MTEALDLLADQPVLLLTVLLAIGATLGRIRLLGVPIGPAAVLFGAIGLSAFATGRLASSNGASQLWCPGPSLSNAKPGPSWPISTSPPPWPIHAALAGSLGVDRSGRSR